MKNTKKLSYSHQYTKKRAVLQKTFWVLKWMFVFLLLSLMACLLAPLFLNNPKQAVVLSNLLHQYRFYFWILHLVFILSALWWWPLYIRYKGRKQNWSIDIIEQASEKKWFIVFALLFLGLLFLLT